MSHKKSPQDKEKREDKQRRRLELLPIVRSGLKLDFADEMGLACD